MKRATVATVLGLSLAAWASKPGPAPCTVDDVAARQAATLAAPELRALLDKKQATFAPMGASCEGNEVRFWLEVQVTSRDFAPVQARGRISVLVDASAPMRKEQVGRPPALAALFRRVFNHAAIKHFRSTVGIKSVEFHISVKAGPAEAAPSWSAIIELASVGWTKSKPDDESHDDGTEANSVQVAVDASTESITRLTFRTPRLMSQVDRYVPGFTEICPEARQARSVQYQPRTYGKAGPLERDFCLAGFDVIVR